MQDLEDYNNAKNYLLNEQNVSRETFLQLEQYVELLLKWNEHINLPGYAVYSTSYYM